MRSFSHTDVLLCLIVIVVLMAINYHTTLSALNYLLDVSMWAIYHAMMDLDALIR
jgi:hypothetical protein